MKVELAYKLTHDGKAHKPDEVVDLPTALASELIHRGRARRHADSAEPTTKEK